MNPERVIELLNATPFKPFKLQFAWGEDVIIDNPKLAIAHDDGETLIVTEYRVSPQETWTRLVALRLVTMLIL